MEIKLAESREDFLKCWEVVTVLRPQLDRERYLTHVLHMMDEGYKMIFIEVGKMAVAFCGYRKQTMLHRDRGIYIDDLSSLPAFQAKGYASVLLKYVMNEAKQLRLKSIHIQSCPHCQDTRRLYLDHGFHIISEHFALEL